MQYTYLNITHKGRIWRYYLRRNDTEPCGTPHNNLNVVRHD